ncbi:uncharacterized protein PGTG_10157 [Puccinia graminis f. sp. tritici CRL 75-36-700-3]|uniref:Uncharacterized protein n=1 Tax=Puccinia graminis f. sp. tritici (strain CRL 75-36-700-3 / race SCCL) TaxID=418459 RepID=E3KJG2_PUCGT|nr:uncharacterized protein PGTG_10157 [Puccinia graminis f. sp. tritici CRL 75-36-700-3]EFP84437.1 hypothetical protein PGTG_10157 [Puccinia graminis f. sp. tritici CRL 75-36-700-3]
MVVLTDRVFFCVVLHAIGVAQLAFASLTSQAKDARKYLASDRLWDAKSAESSIGSRAHGPSSKLGKLDQREELGHDFWDEYTQTYEERASEMRSMVNERNNIWYQIDRLKPESYEELTRMKLQVELLHRGLRWPTIDKVRELGGLELSVDYLIPRDNLQQAAAKTQSSGDSKSSSTRYKTYSRWTDYLPFFKSDPRRTADSKRLLQKSDSFDSSSPKSPDTHRPSAEVAEPKRILTVLEHVLGEQSIPIGDLSMRTAAFRDLSAREQALWRQRLTDSQVVEILESMKTKTMGFKFRDGVSDRTEMIFQLEFLKSFVLLRDYIIRYELLPAKIIGGAEIFNKKTVIEMIELNVQLLFRRWGKQFFDTPDSVVPELDFFTYALATKHFHKSIKAHPVEDHKQVVHVVLDTILTHGPDHFPTGKPASERFEKIRNSFHQIDFLNQALISLAPGTSHHDKSIKDLAIVDLMQDLIKFLQEPEMETDPKQRRIEYQLVYYMMDFLQIYYNSITETVVQDREDRLLVKNQFGFMSAFLKYYRNYYQDNSGYRREHYDDMSTFGSMATSESGDPQFQEWIHKFVNKIIGFTTWKDFSFHRERLRTWINLYETGIFREETQIPRTVDKL